MKTRRVYYLLTIAFVVLCVVVAIKISHSYISMNHFQRYLDNYNYLGSSQSPKQAIIDYERLLANKKHLFERLDSSDRARIYNNMCYKLIWGYDLPRAFGFGEKMVDEGFENGWVLGAVVHQASISGNLEAIKRINSARAADSVLAGSSWDNLLNTALAIGEKKYELCMKMHENIEQSSTLSSTAAWRLMLVAEAYKNMGHHHEAWQLVDNRILRSEQYEELDLVWFTFLCYHAIGFAERAEDTQSIIIYTSALYEKMTMFECPEWESALQEIKELLDRSRQKMQDKTDNPTIK